jgi:hypothetical protein
MIDVEFVKSCVKYPLLIIRFVQDDDLAMVFCATTTNDEKESKEISLNGLSLFGVRKSRGTTPFRLRSDIVPKVFKPCLKKKSEHEWRLQIQPLTEEITIIKRPTHFVCLYPFKDQNKAGHIVDVVVEANLQPLKMWFTVNCTFKPKKDAASENLKTTLQCPDDFTNALYAIFTEKIN